MPLQNSTSVTFSQFTQQQIKKLRDAFQLIDHDGDGSISIQDLDKMFQNIGKKADREQLEQMLEQGDGDLSFPGFLSVVGESFCELPEEEEIVKALRVFSGSDSSELNVNVDELEEYLRSVGMNNEKELEKVLKNFTSQQVSGERVFKGKKFLETVGE